MHALTFGHLIKIAEKFATDLNLGKLTKGQQEFYDDLITLQKAHHPIDESEITFITICGIQSRNCVNEYHKYLDNRSTSRRSTDSITDSQIETQLLMMDSRYVLTDEENSSDLSHTTISATDTNKD